MPRRTKLSKDHEDRISLIMKAYDRKAKECLAKGVKKRSGTDTVPWLGF